jgi:hypothetical protein
MEAKEYKALVSKVKPDVYGFNDYKDNGDEFIFESKEPVLKDKGYLIGDLKDCGRSKWMHTL